MKKGYNPIDFVEINIHGAVVVWGDIGIRQYYGYGKQEAKRKYKEEAWLKAGQFECVR